MFPTVLKDDSGFPMGLKYLSSCCSPLLRSWSAQSMAPVSDTVPGDWLSLLPRGGSGWCLSLRKGAPCPCSSLAFVVGQGWDSLTSPFLPALLPGSQLWCSRLFLLHPHCRRTCLRQPFSQCLDEENELMMAFLALYQCGDRGGWSRVLPPETDTQF